MITDYRAIVLITDWIGGFIGQLLIAALLTWLLRKPLGTKSLIAACAATVVLAVVSWTVNTGGEFALVNALIIYLPTNLAVYFVLRWYAKKEAIAAP
jgi:hypothetical protein